MSIEEELKQANKWALRDANGVHKDAVEAVDFALAMLKRLGEGKKNAILEAALELDDYIAQAIAIVNMLERWEETKGELLLALGEDDLVKHLPTFILGRVLQNFDKRAKDERSK